MFFTWGPQTTPTCRETHRRMLVTPNDTVSFHNFKSQKLQLSVSNPKNKYVAYVSVLSQILNCQGLGRKNQHDILKTDRKPNDNDMMIMIIIIIVTKVAMMMITASAKGESPTRRRPKRPTPFRLPL